MWNFSLPQSRFQAATTGFSVISALEIDHDGDTNESQGDCDDSDPVVFPGAVDVQNGIDDDCDGQLMKEQHLMMMMVTATAKPRPAWEALNRPALH